MSTRSRFYVRTRRAVMCGLLSSALAVPAVFPSAGAAVAQSAPGQSSGRDAAAGEVDVVAGGAVVPADKRDGVLSGGWRDSADVALTTHGDASGFHVLVAAERAGYAWRTVASLSEPGVVTDRWIGNACVTESGRRAVVVYAPRGFANRAELFQRGGFTAVVDLRTGEVEKLPVRSTLAYFNPGCGTGESAVVSQARGGEVPGGAAMATRLFSVDAAQATVGAPVELAGQLTSPVPTQDGIVAASGLELVVVGAGGGLRTVARAASVPFRLVADSGGGVVFMEHAGGVARVRHVASTRGESASRVLAGGDLTAVNVTRGRGGRVWITGEARLVSALPRSVRKLDVGATAEVSSHGHLAVLHEGRTPAPAGAAAAAAPGKAWEQALTSAAAAGAGEPGPVKLDTVVVPTGKRLAFSARAGADPQASRSGAAAHPLNAAAPRGGPGGGGSRKPGTGVRGAMFGASSWNPVDADATCSVPRNDVRSQVYQPTPRQVEWAADQAVINNLRMTRPANWKESGLASWTPQGLFPPRGLEGGGRINVQVLLGILAAESNLWQASGKALSGVIANPLVGNFYGRKVYDDDPSNDWDINFSDADCGYGVSQITDGMRKAGSERPGEVALSTTQQRAAGLDYATNIAAGMQILEDKWNQTRGGGLIHSDGDPKWLENWFFAIWAYNSGFYPNTGGPWGVGWFNNPANPIYPPNRTFFNKNPRDASHPQDWPYPEKVIGWAAYSIATLDGPGFRPAWWVSEAARDAAKPPIYTFCTAANECDPASAAKCTRGDSKCWWHDRVTFNNCAQGYCGNELHRFNSTYPEQPDGTNYPPTCSLAGLPAGALIIDDVATSVPSVRPCSKGWTNAGSFSLNFAADAEGRYPSKVDFHQIGSGFGGHFWFGYSRTPGMHGGKLRVNGTWTFNESLSSWGRVLVHMPDHGAKTQQARYVINLGNGVFKVRYALQRTRENRWVSLGVMKFAGAPKITLSTETRDGDGTQNVAWDAVAIQPLPDKPANSVVTLGDGWASGEGASDPAGGDDYYQESDNNGDLADDKGRNACHRSPHAATRKIWLADKTNVEVGYRADTWDPDMDYQLHACSGASTANVRGGGTGQYGEVSQIDKGYLDENTTLVTLNVGAVDAGLPQILRNCTYTSSCIDNTVFGKIDGVVRNDVEALLRQVVARAPNANVALVGYPKLFTYYGCSNAPGISGGESAWINSIADRLDAMLSDVAFKLAAEKKQVVHVSPIDDFQDKTVCSGGGDTVHGVVTTTTEGDKPGTSPPSQQSYHPKVSGTPLLANALWGNAVLSSNGNVGMSMPGFYNEREFFQRLREFDAIVDAMPGGNKVPSWVDETLKEMHRQTGQPAKDPGPRPHKEITSGESVEAGSLACIINGVVVFVRIIFEPGGTRKGALEKGGSTCATSFVDVGIKYFTADNNNDGKPDNLAGYSEFIQCTVGAMAGYIIARGTTLKEYGLRVGGGCLGTWWGGSVIKYPDPEPKDMEAYWRGLGDVLLATLPPAALIEYTIHAWNEAFMKASPAVDCGGGLWAHPGIGSGWTQLDSPRRLLALTALGTATNYVTFTKWPDGEEPAAGTFFPFPAYSGPTSGGTSCGTTGNPTAMPAPTAAYYYQTEFNPSYPSINDPYYAPENWRAHTATLADGREVYAGIVCTI